MLLFKNKAMTPLLPIILLGLTAFITTVVVEAIYFVCHLWRCLFDGAALSFSWTEPLPVAALSTVAVLLMGFLAARLMSLASEDALDPFAAHQRADDNGRQAMPNGHPAEGTQATRRQSARLAKEVSYALTSRDISR
jgi:hypothetical protein